MKKWLLIILLILIAAPIIGGYYYLSQMSFNTDKLVNLTLPVTTTIYDKNGKKIANIFKKQHRYYARFDEIPPRLIEALLAIEDTTFFEHPGINVDAIMRAIIKDIKAGKLVEGASTITQQLVKNTLLTREKKISRKVKEVIYSLKVERELSKEQILEFYLNQVYLGHSYYGIKTAADGYFRKKLDALTLKEMAILVGLPKAPSFYAPTKNYDLSLGRANRVISRMYELGWIDQTAYEEALQENPKVYDDTLTKNKAPFIVDEVMRRCRDIDDMKEGGYQIYTTIDLELQSAARDALKFAYNAAMKRARTLQDYNASKWEQLNGALVSIDPRNGDILALVGGVDYKKSAFNRATQSRRQPGSSFKPFLYQVALDIGYSGATELVDIARTFDYRKNGRNMKWQPSNYGRNYKGILTLREALVHSNNLATVNLVYDIGLTTMLRELKRYRIANLPHDLSLSLGSISLSPLELAGYYSSFAAEGKATTPTLIRRIDNASGETVREHESNSTQITTPEQAFVMTSILKDVIERGTGRHARVKGIELAGKTGTTNHSVDAWFAGYSPTVETVVWFGNDNNTPMSRKETGGTTAAPAFQYYYKELIRIYPQIKRHFDKPEGLIETTYNGVKEYFTETSKAPKRKPAAPRLEEEELLF
ncbi:MAG: penicillin-binding protein [Sulfurimonas sp.]|nr:MAG: penicillin-binding protein [Sulfurimonas sp.]